MANIAAKQRRFDQTFPAQGLRDFVGNIVSGAKSTLHKVQVARMESVLHSYDDAFLAQIGVKRNEISKHASWLMQKESDS
ncbi:MAG: hypothetical protein ABJ360_24010 [Roseobacter sp.]